MPTKSLQHFPLGRCLADTNSCPKHRNQPWPADGTSHSLTVFRAGRTRPSLTPRDGPQDRIRLFFVQGVGGVFHSAGLGVSSFGEMAFRSNFLLGHPGFAWAARREVTSPPAPHGLIFVLLPSPFCASIGIGPTGVRFGAWIRAKGILPSDSYTHYI